MDTIRVFEAFAGYGSQHLALKEILQRLSPTHRGGVIVWDDYNECFPKDQDVIGTITTQIGNPSPRHGFRIIEVYETHNLQDVSISKRSQ